MKQYHDFLKHILQNGNDKEDRTGTGTKSVFGYQMRFDLSKGFPLLTTKKIHFKSVALELIWFLNGNGNNNWLKERGVSIWNEWADPQTGDLGPIYGVQWRNWPTPQGEHIDQLQEVIDILKKDPNSRRMVVSAWNVADLDKMALQPCHVLFQFYVSNNKLSCHLYQRSADAFLGVPFNIASYALLTHLIALECNMEVGDFIWSGGDCHIYNNHYDQVNTILSRDCKELPEIKINKKSIFDYDFSDFELLNYNPHSAIKAPVSV